MEVPEIILSDVYASRQQALLHARSMLACSLGKHTSCEAVFQAANEPQQSTIARRSRIIITITYYNRKLTGLSYLKARKQQFIFMQRAGILGVPQVELLLYGRFLFLPQLVPLRETPQPLYPLNGSNK